MWLVRLESVAGWVRSGRGAMAGTGRVELWWLHRRRRAAVSHSLLVWRRYTTQTDCSTRSTSAISRWTGEWTLLSLFSVRTMGNGRVLNHRARHSPVRTPHGEQYSAARSLCRRSTPACPSCTRRTARREADRSAKQNRTATRPVPLTTPSNLSQPSSL